MDWPIKIEALAISTTDGTSEERSLYMGCMTAVQLSYCAVVPSYQVTSGPADIAERAASKRMRDGWQRPLDTDRADTITERYTKEQEFMPNPVLLAVGKPELVTVTPQRAGSKLCDIDIDCSADIKPLIVLDGQHRIAGLAAITSRDHTVPFVLLDEKTTPTEQAQVFAEVSTTAAPLDKRHQEWLKYAFSLDQYHESDPKHKTKAEATETLLFLCLTEKYSNMHNPFFDKIKLTPGQKDYTAYGNGFKCTIEQPGGYSIDLRDTILTGYYKKPIAKGVDRLKPEDLARELATAVRALDVITNTRKSLSAFSGTTGEDDTSGNQPGVKPIQEAYIRSVLHRLTQKSNNNWKNILFEYEFHTSDWHIRQWASTGGEKGGMAKKVAKNVFVRFIGMSAPLPPGEGIPGYLKGNDAFFNIEASKVDKNSKPKPTEKLLPIPEIRCSQDGGVINTDGRRHLKFIDLTPNIGSLNIKITKQGSPVQDILDKGLRSQGMIFTNGTYIFTFTATFFGGETNTFSRTINI